MRIGELARRAGVPVPTIKYYLREGMLPPGERTSPNQVAYADEHLRRLRLIRAILEVGGLSIAEARAILAEIDSPGADVHKMLGAAQAAVTKAPYRGAEGDLAAAERELAELVERHGWATDREVPPDGNPAWPGLVRIVAAYRELGQPELLTLLDEYAAAADRLAAAELAVVSRLPTADGKVEGALLGMLLGDAAMAALRRIAQEYVSERLQAHRAP